jgi:hypothetical protein
MSGHRNAELGVPSVELGCLSVGLGVVNVELGCLSVGLAARPGRGR